MTLLFSINLLNASEKLPSGVYCLCPTGNSERPIKESYYGNITLDDFYNTTHSSEILTSLFFTTIAGYGIYKGKTWKQKVFYASCASLGIGLSYLNYLVSPIVECDNSCERIEIG